MGMNDDDGCDKDDRTIFVQFGPSEKMSEAILYELFYQAGPIQRVSIPKHDDGRIKTFGFVEYKHVSAVDYALNIFAGTKLFGRELCLRNRNASKNRSDRDQHQQSSMSLTHGYGNSSVGSYRGADQLNSNFQQVQQQLLQQQLIMMATGHNNFQNIANAGAQMFGVSPNPQDYASSRSDNAGSHRDNYVDRNRYHREENRSGRSKPYRRSRSRSRSPQHSQRNRDKSPVSHRGRYQNNSRNSDDRSGYSRWGKR